MRPKYNTGPGKKRPIFTINAIEPAHSNNSEGPSLLNINHRPNFQESNRVITSNQVTPGNLALTSHKILPRDSVISNLFPTKSMAQSISNSKRDDIKEGEKLSCLLLAHH